MLRFRLIALHLQYRKNVMPTQAVAAMALVSGKFNIILTNAQTEDTAQNTPKLAISSETSLTTAHQEMRHPNVT